MASGSANGVDTEDPVAVGELAKRTGVSTATINYYVNIGLLPRPEKTGQTRALYPASHAQLIEHIKALKGRGLPLRVIKKVLDSDDPASELGISGESESEEEEFGNDEPTAPMSRDRLLRESGLTTGLFGRLVKAGLLRRPHRVKGRNGLYDRHDLAAARACALLLQAGVGMDVLARHAEFEPVARAEAHFLAEHLAVAGSARVADDRSRVIEASFDGMRRYLRRVNVESAYPGWLPD